MPPLPPSGGGALRGLPLAFGSSSSAIFSLASVCSESISPWEMAPSSAFSSIPPSIWRGCSISPHRSCCRCRVCTATGSTPEKAPPFLFIKKAEIELSISAFCVAALYSISRFSKRNVSLSKNSRTVMPNPWAKRKTVESVTVLLLPLMIHCM